MINGFQARGRDISAHERARTIGKKIANWTVGKSTCRAGRAGPGTGGPGARPDYAIRSPRRANRVVWPGSRSSRPRSGATRSTRALSHRPVRDLLPDRPGSLVGADVPATSLEAVY